MHDQKPPLIDSPALQRYGWPELVVVPDPPAEEGFEITTDGSFLVRVLAITFTLSTSASVADRAPYVQVRDETGSTVIAVQTQREQAASLTVTYSFSAWASAEVPALIFDYVPLPAVLMLPTWRMRVNVGAMSTGDQISEVRVLQERFYTYGDRRHA